MELDLRTIAFIQGLLFIAQSVALFVQYQINKALRGVEYWLAGSVFLAMGLVFSSFLAIKPLEMLARIGNPLIVLGYILLYVGILRFFRRQENKGGLLAFYAVFLMAYYYYMLVDDAISGRTVVVSAAVSLITLMSAFQLFFRHDAAIARSANFTALFFLTDGIFMGGRTVLTLMSSPILSYDALGKTPMHQIAYILLVITSTLWTFGFIIMVNQRLYAENRKEQEQLQMIFNTSPDAASLTRLEDGVFIDVNVGFLKMSGCTRGDVIGRSVFDHDVWADVSDRGTYISEIQKNGFCENMEFGFRRKDGSPFTGLISGRILAIDGEPHIYNVVRDITERKRTEAALIESEATYRSILNASPDDITITDLEGRVLMVSQAAKRMFGYADDFDDFSHMKFSDFIVPEDIERALSNIRLIFNGGTTRPNEYRAIRQDGSIFDIEVNSSCVRGADGKPSRIIIIARDISARKASEKRIQALMSQLEIERNAAQINSITDSLTGLANRRCFDETMDTEFNRLKRSGAPLSLIMIDVDHFKNYNDTYGHIEGDACLRRIARTLQALVGRAPDVIARYGGEEFVVILPETDRKGALELAERIRKAVEALEIPHAGSEQTNRITISLGVVTVRTTEFAASQQIVLLADEAMYQAKRAGRNRTCYAGEDCGSQHIASV